MILYKIDKKSKISVTIIGHAHANYQGFDPVCGMVSIVTQSALAGCELYGKCKKTFEHGHLYFSVSNTKETYAIVSAMEFGLKELAEKYPECIKEGGI